MTLSDDVFAWLASAPEPMRCDSTAFIYDDMDSQSGRSLPLLYVPFDPARRGHWRDRGALFDFLASTGGAGRRLLDFGPGDGWPSLLLAPFAAEVVGIDASSRRVKVCRRNAERLGVHRARFVLATPGEPLPFDDQAFDGATAASSIEQSPDPRGTLRELHRVLRPGGRLRIRYEALARYGGGREREAWLWPIDPASCRLILYDRDIGAERVTQFGLTYAWPAHELRAVLADRDRTTDDGRDVEDPDGRGAPVGRDVSIASLTVEGLERARPALVEVRVCETRHPSGETLAAWLRQAGFEAIRPTHSGAEVAGMLYDACPADDRPADMDAVDAYVRPAVEVACRLSAPIAGDPMITAVKPAPRSAAARPP